MSEHRLLAVLNVEGLWYARCSCNWGSTGSSMDGAVAEWDEHAGVGEVRPGGDVALVEKLREAHSIIRGGDAGDGAWFVGVNEDGSINRAWPDDVTDAPDDPLRALFGGSARIAKVVESARLTEAEAERDNARRCLEMEATARAEMAVFAAAARDQRYWLMEALEEARQSLREYRDHEAVERINAALSSLASGREASKSEAEKLDAGSVVQAGLEPMPAAVGDAAWIAFDGAPRNSSASEFLAFIKAARLVWEARGVVGKGDAPRPGVRGADVDRIAATIPPMSIHHPEVAPHENPWEPVDPTVLVAHILHEAETPPTTPAAGRQSSPNVSDTPPSSLVGETDGLGGEEDAAMLARLLAKRGISPRVLKLAAYSESLSVFSRASLLAVVDEIDRALHEYPLPADNRTED